MTPSPVLWGQEKFRDTNNASDGFGKWFARIVTGSVRQLPYSLSVDGRTTYIVGYSYTPNGIQEPAVGNNWYPVNIDEYDNQEYASVDAYIASEYGQATLQGCGVTSLVPLATAIQRLADNDINITVHDRTGAYRRFVSENVGALVDSDGKCVIWRIPEDTEYIPTTTETANRFDLKSKTATSSVPLIEAFGEGTRIETEPAVGITIEISGISYRITEVTATVITLSPTPPSW